MYNYSIMPLDTDHLDEICQDIREQTLQGITDCALFCMTLVPEGDPPIPKAELLCEKYDLFAQRLREDDIPCGILMQASIGHGYKLDRDFPFQHYTRLTDGGAEYIACPYDEGFRDYIRHTMSVLAAHRPDLIMVDDDFRLMDARGGLGCTCPIHMDALQSRLGRSITREELWAQVNAGNTALQDTFIRTQIDSLAGAARAMREGIDAVDPSIPGAFCCVGNGCEGAVEIATVLAGKGNPVIVRINNGNYHPAGARYLTLAMARAATQMAVLKRQGHVDAILAETDTCPQNRYSTGAQSLHSHFTGTILEGANGAKHWITRLRAFEPASGMAYRRILGNHTGFYQRLSALVPTLRWRGCCIPLSGVSRFPFQKPGYAQGWASCVLERLGLPMYFSAEPGSAVFLDNTVDSLFTDEELLQMFRGTVFVDGSVAQRLTQRGFAPYLGVTATEWDGPHLSGEQLHINGKCCNAQVHARKLTPLDDSVLAESTVYHQPDGKTQIPLFPGVTVYRNALGGTAVTFCGNTLTQFHYLEAFSFLNESRKLQLIDLLQRCGNLPVYYPDDAEVYLRAADMEDGRVFCAVFNIGLDPIEELPLVCGRPVHAIERLLPDGSTAPVSFSAEGNRLTLHTPANTLDPVILFLK